MYCLPRSSHGKSWSFGSPGPSTFWGQDGVAGCGWTGEVKNTHNSLVICWRKGLGWYLNVYIITNNTYGMNIQHIYYIFLWGFGISMRHYGTDCNHYNIQYTHTHTCRHVFQLFVPTFAWVMYRILKPASLIWLIFWDSQVISPWHLDRIVILIVMFAFSAASGKDRCGNGESLRWMYLHRWEVSSWSWWPGVLFPIVLIEMWTETNTSWGHSHVRRTLSPDYDRKEHNCCNSHLEVFKVYLPSAWTI